MVLAVAASAGFAILVFLAEISEPRSFPDLPLALWWAVITLTSVGYGDVTPASYQGRLVGGVCALAGMLLVAVPVAVVATSFGEYRALYREMSALLQRRASEVERHQPFLRGGPRERERTPLTKTFLKNRVESWKK